VQKIEKKYTCVLLFHIILLHLHALIFDLVLTERIIFTLKGVGNEMNGGWWVYTNDRYINGTAALEFFFHFDRVVSL